MTTKIVWRGSVSDLVTDVVATLSYKEALDFKDALSDELARMNGKSLIRCARKDYNRQEAGAYACRVARQRADNAVGNSWGKADGA